MVCDLVLKFLLNMTSLCLNPYSIGIWSATPPSAWWEYNEALVLILILLEYGLRHEEVVSKLALLKS